MVFQTTKVMSWILLIAIIANKAFGQSEFTAKFEYRGREYFGLPLGFDGQRQALLDSAGRLIMLRTNVANDFEIVSNEFQAYSKTQIEEFLTKEFGDRYDVTQTERFVVVHPWGHGKVFADPFEVLHDHFVDFFEANGIELKKPMTPLVAIVLRSRPEFNRYLNNEVEINSSSIRGYYSRASNRITTYDPSGKIRREDDRWLYSAPTVIHEAAHQTAFNTGLHNRFSPPPKWLSEGIATLFEVPFFGSPKLKKHEQTNPVRLAQLRQRLLKGSVNAALINLIANDKLFVLDAELAYALSWGVNYHLQQSQPEKYFRYVADDAKRKNFQPYPSDQRLRDFVAVFGNDFEGLEQQMRKRFLPNE